tara:strand:- start:10781 stop:11035 length:255 start_codon:yes stop_codon:yes gene_type:complete
MEMEIPTKEIIEQLDSRLVNGIAGPVALEAIDTIKAQALEIRELQAVIVRLRGEASAKRRMSDFRSLPEPRPVWEQFKRTWKEN